MDSTTTYLLTNPQDPRDQITVSRIDDGFWMARRFSDPRMDLATLRNWKEYPFSATLESWNCQEGQRDFWNKVLKEWKRSTRFIVYGEPQTDQEVDLNRIKKITGGDLTYSS